MQFLFGSDQRTICRGIQKIERLIRKWWPIPEKVRNISKRLKTREEMIESISMVLWPLHTVLNNQFQDQRIGREGFSTQIRRKNIRSITCIQLTKGFDNLQIQAQTKKR
ncbi:MAG: hypothetical protein AB7U98_12220 [Candidatus Nitrosocosmicus sp.]